MGNRAPVRVREGPPTPRTPRPLIEGLAAIEERVKSARRIAVLLDFDGTLTEITSTPEGARLGPQARDTLLALSRKAPLALISGRALGDLRDRVGLPNLIYAGCHGLEIRGPGLEFIEPAAESEAPALTQLADRLADRLHHISEAVVENKGLSISIHFRQVAEPAKREVDLAVQAETSRPGSRLRVRRGKEVWEISAAVDWNKGRAARWILGSTGNRDALPLYIGDDVTDEDAFRELQDGITIRVGQSTDSAAAWVVAGPAEVCNFLGWLECTLP